MRSLRVSLTKLERYCNEHGGFELQVKGDQVLLTFVPSFPEALDKGGATLPTVLMQGNLLEGKTVEFVHVEIEDSFGHSTIKDREEAALAYDTWLDYIESNY